MASPSKLARKIAAKARQATADAQIERAKRKRARERDALAVANQLTPDGFTPKMRAKLQDASKRANEDPRAKAIVEQASLDRRVEQLRREKGIGKVSPPLFYGEPADARGAPIADPKLIPPSVGDMFSKREKK
jgi:hypothetical protein